MFDAPTPLKIHHAEGRGPRVQQMRAMIEMRPLDPGAEFTLWAPPNIARTECCRALLVNHFDDDSRTSA